MADKGFDLKVLIPTDDGISISEKGLENAAYFLMYNISNRSYQFSGKVKTSELFNHKKTLQFVLEEFCNQNKVDQIISTTSVAFSLKIDVIQFSNEEIGVVLNHLIDQIDQNKI